MKAPNTFKINSLSPAPNRTLPKGALTQFERLTRTIRKNNKQ